MIADSITKMNSNELIEILDAISACNNLSEKIRMHLSNECPIDDISELANLYTLGGLGSSIKYLADMAAIKAEWIEQNSTDEQAQKSPEK